MNRYQRIVAPFLLVVLFAFLTVPSAKAWGDEGHRYVNRVAAQKLPNDMPAFFKNATARLEFLGPEPDRWRDNKQLFFALRELNAPDHFIDMEKTEDFQHLPNDRHKYGDWLRSQGKDPKDIGYLPYSILEYYEKIQVLFRLWRDPQHAAEREQIEQNIVYYAGVLGHYVADGAQPLHATNHYNGWSGSSNPEQFTREPLHWRFEGEYVKAQVKAEDFSGLVNTSTKLNDAFADTMKFLFDSNSHVVQLYRMDKTARWDANNRNAESKAFVTKRLAAGSQMLSNLWYTAYVNSAK
jgi:hypothetical protein